MWIVRIRALLLFCAAAVSLHFMASDKAGYADEPTEMLTVSVGTIPYVLHSEKPGPHNEVLDAVLLKAAKPGYQITMVPHYRANRDFFSHQSDCLYITVSDPVLYPEGSGENIMAPDAPLYKNSIRLSQPINSIQLRAYTRQGEPVIRSYEDLEGKVIIGVRTQLQNIHDKLKEHGAIILMIEDFTKGLQLLDKGRADAVITYSMDVQVMVDDEHTKASIKDVPILPRHSHDQSFSLLSVSEHIACWRSPEADQFLNRVNGHIQTLQETGLLEAIFADYQ